MTRPSRSFCSTLRTCPNGTRLPSCNCSTDPSIVCELFGTGSTVPPCGTASGCAASTCRKSSNPSPRSTAPTAAASTASNATPNGGTSKPRTS